MEEHTDLYWTDDGTLTALGYRDEILRPIVRPFVGAVGPGFLLVHDNGPPDAARLHPRLSRSSVMPWTVSECAHCLFEVLKSHSLSMRHTISHATHCFSH